MHVPGKSLLSGLASGPDSIIKRVQGLKSFGVNFKLNFILIGYTGFILSLHNIAIRGNLLLDEQVAFFFELTEGKIVSMATYLSDVEGINIFLLKGHNQTLSTLLTHYFLWL
jgi:hypothetical protein